MAKSDHALSLYNAVTTGGEISAPPRLHLDFLDGLRALLALIVALDHAFLSVWHPERFGSLPPLFYPLRYLYILGSLCVGAFLVISGFCLMLPVVRDNGVLKSGAIGFYRRRIRRIVPPYYCAILLALLAETVKIRPEKLTPVDIFNHLALVHNLFPSTIFSINVVFWSIAVECQIYLLFPLIIASWNRAGKALTLLGLAGIGIIGLCVINNSSLSGLCLHLYPMFALGMTGAYIAFDASRPMRLLRTRVSWSLVCLVALGTLLLLFQMLGVEKALTQVVYEYWLVGIAVCAILVMGAQAQLPRALRCLTWKPLVWIGTFSYSLYLIHLPLLEAFRDCAGFAIAGSKGGFFVLLVFVVLPVIAALAFGFFWLCERPFLPASRGMQRQQSAANATSPAP